MEKFVRGSNPDAPTNFNEDSHMSSGSTILNLDRNFIGVEIDEKYFKAAEKRLNGRPVKLFSYENIKVINK